MLEIFSRSCRLHLKYFWQYLWYWKWFYKIFEGELFLIFYITFLAQVFSQLYFCWKDFIEFVRQLLAAVNMNGLTSRVWFYLRRRHHHQLSRSLGTRAARHQSLWPGLLEIQWVPQDSRELRPGKWKRKSFKNMTIFLGGGGGGGTHFASFSWGEGVNYIKIYMCSLINEKSNNTVWIFFFFFEGGGGGGKGGNIISKFTLSTLVPWNQKFMVGCK